MSRLLAARAQYVLLNFSQLPQQNFDESSVTHWQLAETIRLGEPPACNLSQVAILKKVDSCSSDTAVFT